MQLMKMYTCFVYITVGLGQLQLVQGGVFVLRGWPDQAPLSAIVHRAKAPLSVTVHRAKAPLSVTVHRAKAPLSVTVHRAKAPLSVTVHRAKAPLSVIVHRSWLAQALLLNIVRGWQEGRGQEEVRGWQQVRGQWEVRGWWEISCNSYLLPGALSWPWQRWAWHQRTERRSQHRSCSTDTAPPPSAAATPSPSGTCNHIPHTGQHYPNSGVKV